MGPLNPIQRAATELLHFHPKWFAYSMLPLEFFEQQLQHYYRATTLQLDEDNTWLITEHHRYHALNTFLSLHPTLTDEQLHRYVELCELDEDISMGQSALVNLIRSPSLSEEQRHWLATHPRFENSKIERVRRFVTEITGSQP